MNAGTVAGVALHQNFAAPHGVAGRVPGRAVDADFSLVHGVAGRVLRVAENGDFTAVQIRAESVARGAADGDVPPPSPLAMYRWPLQPRISTAVLSAPRIASFSF